MSHREIVQEGVVMNPRTVSASWRHCLIEDQHMDWCHQLKKNKRVRCTWGARASLKMFPGYRITHSGNSSDTRYRFSPERFAGPEGKGWHCSLFTPTWTHFHPLSCTSSCAPLDIVYSRMCFCKSGIHMVLSLDGASLHVHRDLALTQMLYHSIDRHSSFSFSSILIHVKAPS